VERGRRVYYSARNDCPDSLWILATGAAGIDCPDLSKVMSKFAEQFGLTPAARSRIVADNSVNNPSDEMEQLLGGDD